MFITNFEITNDSLLNQLLDIRNLMSSDDKETKEEVLLNYNDITRLINLLNNPKKDMIN